MSSIFSTCDRRCGVCHSSDDCGACCGAPSPSSSPSPSPSPTPAAQPSPSAPAAAPGKPEAKSGELKFPDLKPGERPRILSGSRPTGQQHLGNYIGALAQWVPLQDKFECFFMVADWHALTSQYRHTQDVVPNIQQQVTDWLSVGLDPARSTIFVQSAIKEHAELSLLLGMFTPLGLMERCTSWKELVIEQNIEELRTYGFLGYPCLQAADILIYDAHLVPVGRDQVEHVEKCQDIAEKVNFQYGKVFVVPQWKISEIPVLLGNDGRKMSKSYGNCIYLQDDAKTVMDKTGVMVTDPARVRRHDPGNPEVCSAYSYHKVFTDVSQLDTINVECRRAGIGCRECKKILGESLNEKMAPWRAKREELSSKPGAIQEVLEAGNAAARRRARQTMERVREMLHLYR